ncbi:Uma2 family endonuclease [Micromonospora chersina]|uniref:Uma2 family endonuclease n=1 Tax=Micromonospora chersina TaxID=47854 RepID=UPI00371DE19E
MTRSSHVRCDDGPRDHRPGRHRGDRLRPAGDEADDVRLVCEVISPSNAATDKVLKMHYYAAADIEWYLLAEQETGTLHLYRRHGRHYREESVTKPGAVLELELAEPVRATIRPEGLVP